MKKIQISTVKQTADIQVININAYIIAKAVRASLTLHNAFDWGIHTISLRKVDEHGKEVFDENKKPVYEEKRVLDGDVLNNEFVLNAYDTAIELIDELVKAFEEE